MSGSDIYDVVIVGGGPAGAAAAIALAGNGRRVLLLEEAHPRDFKIGESLPPAARPILKELGVWDRFTVEGHLPSYGNLSAWGTRSLHCSEFIYDPNGHGWHLDRARFDKMLRDAARSAGAEVHEGATLKHMARAQPDNLWRLSISGGQDNLEAQCRRVIDASGRRYVVARQQGAHRLADDALVSFFGIFHQPGSAKQPDQDSRTLIEAAPDGWWYTALLPSEQRIVVYLTDADLTRPRSLLTPESFLSELGKTDHVGACLIEHGYTLKGQPKGGAAQSARLDRFFGDGWLATGDAALSFDPLSSQGILTALYTGMQAGHDLHKSLSGEQDALAVYGKRLEAIYKAYLGNRLVNYSAENRWPRHVFWQRRRDASPRDIVM